MVRFLANGSDIKRVPQVEHPGFIKPLHPSIYPGWQSQSTGGGTQGTDSSLSTLSLLNLLGVKDKGCLFTCSLIILPTSELSSALSEPMHEPSLPVQTFNYADFLTGGKHGCQSCRA